MKCILMIVNQIRILKYREREREGENQVYHGSEIILLHPRQAEFNLWISLILGSNLSFIYIDWESVLITIKLDYT